MGTSQPNQPSIPAKEIQGDSGLFTNFMRKLMQVPHSEIKAELEAEKAAKRPKASSRVSGVSPKRAT
jgi:hypothetical protein